MQGAATRRGSTEAAMAELSGRRPSRLEPVPAWTVLTQAPLTRQALAHLCFVPDRPFLLGAAAYGTLAGVVLRPGGSSGRLDAEVLWQEALMSNVGRLTITGEGGKVLASCFTHGVQRYDLRGR